MTNWKSKNKGFAPSASENHCKSITLEDLCQDLDLQYRIKVLLYDLNHVGQDGLSALRLSSTTNELYISEPYFSEFDAVRVRAASVDKDTDDRIPEIFDSQASKTTQPETNERITVQDAIHSKMTNFFEKRKASGDARPCGPHDMAPVYASVFGIAKDELKDEKFLGRLRRSGLGELPKNGNASSSRKGKKGKNK